MSLNWCQIWQDLRQLMGCCILRREDSSSYMVIRISRISWTMNKALNCLNFNLSKMKIDQNKYRFLARAVLHYNHQVKVHQITNKSTTFIASLATFAINAIALNRLVLITVVSVEDVCCEWIITVDGLPIASGRTTWSNSFFSFSTWQWSVLTRQSYG